MPKVPNIQWLLCLKLPKRQNSNGGYEKHGPDSLHLREGREHKTGLWDAGCIYFLTCICFLTCMCVCMLIRFNGVQVFATLRTVAHHGILQPRILEWVAIPSSRGIFRPKD